MDDRIYLRSERFNQLWSVDMPDRNPEQTQDRKRSLMAEEQQIRPFYGPTQRGVRPNRDFYHSRAAGHHTALNQHMKLELLIRYETEVRLHGGHTKLAELLRSQLSEYDNRACETPTVHYPKV